MDTEPPPTTPAHFPFAGTDKHTLDAIGRVILSVENMIAKEARHRFPDTHGDDFEEICQVVRIHIALHSLPRFDSSTGVKPSTFLCQCIRYRLLSLRPRQRKPGSTRGRRPRVIRLAAVNDDDLPSHRTTASALIESVAMRMRSGECDLDLAPAERELFDALLDAPSSTSVSEVGRSLGLKPTTACSTMKRITRKVLKKAEEEFF